MAGEPGAGEQVGATARWTAAVRAQESERTDALFVDPWAAALAGSAGMAWLAERPPGSGLPMVLRTRYFDDFLLRVTGELVIRQVVLVAAGLDTRAFRLSWPGPTHIFELDRAAVLRYKAQILDRAGARPTCERTTLAADLTAPWAAQLASAGFDAGQAAVWLLEGFLFYLPTTQIIQILDELTTLAAPGSWLGFDIVNHAVLTSPWTRAWVEMQAQAGAPWLGTLEDPVAMLAARGWVATLSQAGAPDAHFGRWTLPVIPTTAPDMPHNWYVTAHR
jgi:methyltransferase (TIGR00027 family)